MKMNKKYFMVWNFKKKFQPLKIAQELSRSDFLVKIVAFLILQAFCLTQCGLVHCNINSLPIIQCAKGGVGETVPHVWGVLSERSERRRGACPPSGRAELTSSTIRN